MSLQVFIKRFGKARLRARRPEGRLTRKEKGESMRTRKKAKYEEGPFSQALGKIAIARVLDQSLFIGRLEFTVSILAEATGLTYHTIKSCLKHLQNIQWVTPTRMLGNAQAYKFNVENHMSGIVKWAYDYQQSRLEVAE